MFILTFWKSEWLKKIKLISKLATSQPDKETITICLLPNISKSKGNQIRKFALLINYNMRNIFLEKSYTKCGGETSEKSELSLSLDQ